MADLGKVGIVLKGAWSNSATYEVLDAVSYNNGFYIAKQAVPAGTVPTNTTYWQAALVAPVLKINESLTADSSGIINGTFPTGGTRDNLVSIQAFTATPNFDSVTPTIRLYSQGYRLSGLTANTAYKVIASFIL